MFLGFGESDVIKTLMLIYDKSDDEINKVLDAENDVKMEANFIFGCCYLGLSVYTINQMLKLFKNIK